MSRFIASSFFVAVASFLQRSDIYLLGIKPNFALSLVLALSVAEKSWLKRIILILISVILLKSYPGIDVYSILYLVASIASIILIDVLPAKPLPNLLAAISVGTVIINYGNLLSSGFILELTYNLIIGFVYFLIINRYYDLEKN